MLNKIKEFVSEYYDPLVAKGLVTSAVVSVTLAFIVCVTLPKIMFAAMMQDLTVAIFAATMISFVVTGTHIIHHDNDFTKGWTFRKDGVFNLHNIVLVAVSTAVMALIVYLI